MSQEADGMWNLDVNACYFHSLILGKDDTLKVFASILKDGKILSLAKGAYDNEKVRINSKDEICLSKVDNLDVTGSAYDLFVKKKLSFIIKKNIPGVYAPEFVEMKDVMRVVHGPVTDIVGEVRIKNEIPLDYVVGINFPVGFISNSRFGYKYFFSSKEDYNRILLKGKKQRMLDIISFYDNLKDIMEKHNISLPIYDIESHTKISSVDDIIKIKKIK